MLAPLLLALVAIAINMIVQVCVVVVMLRVLKRRFERGLIRPSIPHTATILIIVLFVLFGGHLFQIAVWAILFLQLNQFSDFATAFYHSTVNFATLGYGDVVMNERWRLLGALQAAGGVLMFGLSTGALVAVMSFLIQKGHEDAKTEP
jgi:hypothetical protein